jgi:hypothetical protein
VISRRWMVALAVTVAVAVGTVLTAVAVGTEDVGTQRAAEKAGALPELGCSLYVSTTGSDDAPGSPAQPWRTIQASLPKLKGGDTLCVRAGIYDEKVTGTVPPGTAASRITVLGVGEDDQFAEIRGGLALVDPDFWTISGLRVTNPSPGGDEDPLVSIVGGTGWIFERNEVVDGPYAGVLVGASQRRGPPTDYIIRDNVVHDTRAANLYLNPSRFSTGGLVERNIFFDSETENAKLGWGGDEGCTGRKFTDFGIGEVTFRYNTLHHAVLAALIIAEPGGLHDVDVYGNLFTEQPDQLVRYDSVEGCLGDRVTVRHNAGGAAPRFSQDFEDSSENVEHERGNVFPIDPDYSSTEPDGFLPRNPEAQRFGRYAVG